MYTRILVPLDGSGLAERALPHAEAVAQATGGEIIIARVVVPPLRDVAPGAISPEVRANALRLVWDDAERYLAAVRGELRRRRISVRAVLVEGFLIAAEILDLAQREAVDLIVMSTHGRSGVARWVFGSVAQKVLQQAPCPVMLVPVHEARPSPSSPQA